MAPSGETFGPAYDPAAQPSSASSRVKLGAVLMKYSMNRGLIFGIVIVVALLSFELFNYSTTEFALADLLGDLRFAGLRWATILALAFCGIDFGGIARLFTPEKGQAEQQTEVWYLLAAWFLAATMNAMLTWWGVSLALLNHSHLGNEILSREQLLSIVPVFVAVLVWLIRILLIGTFTLAGSRLFTQAVTSAGEASWPPAFIPAGPRPNRSQSPWPGREPVSPPTPKPVANGTAVRPAQPSERSPKVIGGDEPRRPAGPSAPPTSRPAVRPAPKPVVRQPVPAMGPELDEPELETRK